MKMAAEVLAQVVQSHIVIFFLDYNGRNSHFFGNDRSRLVQTKSCNSTLVGEVLLDYRDHQRKLEAIKRDFERNRILGFLIVGTAVLSTVLIPMSMNVHLSIKLDFLIEILLPTERGVTCVLTCQSKSQFPLPCIDNCLIGLLKKLSQPGWCLDIEDQINILCINWTCNIICIQSYCHSLLHKSS